MYLSPTHTLPFSWKRIQIVKTNWDDSGLLGCALHDWVSGSWHCYSTSGTTYPAIQWHIPEDRNPGLQCREHLKKYEEYNNGTSGTTDLLCFITGYMFQPIYRSSSGLLTRQSITAMHDGIPTCTAVTEYLVKRPEDDLWTGRNM